MHEFGVTEAIVNGLLGQLRRENVSKVVRVKFRRSSAFSEEVLRQTFSILGADTPLQDAELVVEVSVLSVTCLGCGQRSDVTSEDLVGHMFICPGCGAVREIAEAHDLELIEVQAQSAEHQEQPDV